MSRLRRLLEHRHAHAAVLLLATLWVVPSFAIGFYADDWALLAFLEGRLPLKLPPWDLYNFVPGTATANRAVTESGAVPWWTAEDLRLHLVRPLASLLLAVDRKLFGDSPWGYHAHSIAWFLGGLALLSRLYKRLLPSAASTLALAIYALGSGRMMAYAWISARHLALVLFFSIGALLCVVRAATDGWRLGRWLAPLLLALALASGEAALGGVALVVAVAAFAPLGGLDQGRRITLAVPAVVVGLSYLIAYKLIGGGAHASGGYVEPLTEPARFIAVGALRLPLLLSSVTLGAPAELGVFFPEMLIGMGIVGAALAGAATLLVWPRLASDTRQTLSSLALGALLSLIAGLGGFPGSRQLIMVDVFSASLFAVLLTTGARAQEESKARVFATRALVGLFGVLHLGFSPLAAAGSVATTIETARKVEAIGRSAALKTLPPNARVFLLGTADPMVFLYAPARRVLEAPDAWACWSPIMIAPHGQRITRADQRTLVVDVIGGEMLRTPFETLYRDGAYAMPVGSTRRQCGVTYRVEAERGGRPSRISIQFEAAEPASRLDALGAPERAEPGSPVLLRWTGAALERITVPVGESRVVPHARGPIGLL